MLTALTQLELATGIVVVYQTGHDFFLIFSMISVADIAFIKNKSISIKTPNI